MQQKIPRDLAPKVRSIFIAKILLCYSFALHSSLTLSSVEDLNHAIDQWPYNSKLSQSTILGIVKDRQNFLWLLTLDGISRFDGNYFLDFRPYKSGAGFIPSSNVIQIIVNTSGDVFALTDDEGLLIYDRIRNQFVQKELNDEELLKSVAISNGFVDKEGSVWIGGRNGEVFRVKPRLNLIEKVDVSSVHEIVDFSQSEHGSIFALTKNGTILKILGGQTSQEKVFFPCINPGMEVSAVTAIDDSSLWIGTRGSGLYIANIESQKCDTLRLDSTDESQENQPIIHDILYSNSSGLTWVSTDQGLYRIDKDQRFIFYNTSNSNISDDWIITVSESDEGVYWVGTYDGLNYAIPTHFEIFGTGKSSRIHSVVAIDSHDKKGGWIAMYDGLKYFDFETKSHFDHDEILDFSQLKNTQIMSLNVDQNGIWVGYHSSGLEHYSFGEKEKTFYGIDENRTLSSNAITKIINAKSGQVLIGTYGGGLNIISKAGDVASISVGDNKVIMLHQTREGLVIIGTESGIFSFQLDSNKLSKVNFDYSNHSLFSEPLFWSITESANGDLWLGTKLQGLFLWRMDQASKTRPEVIIPVNPQLKNLTIYALETDNEEKIWMSTNSGLLSYDPLERDIQTYSILHGLHKAKFDHGVSHKDVRGNLYFGGNSGYVRFHPSSVRLRNVPPELALTKLERASGADGFDITTAFASNPFRLNHKDYFVKFTFSVLDFLDPDKNQYRYKLEGFDPEWIENGTRNTATYTNLPAGNYELQVQGANSAGIWNREGVALKVEVLPAPWRTWWAYTFYVLSGAFAIWVLMRWYHTYMVKESALERAHNLQEVAHRTEDDLQEQYELQDRLLQSVYHHNRSTLKLVSDCISSQSHRIPDHIYREAIESNTRRVGALAVLEDCIYYQGDEILADLRKYVDMIIPMLLREAPVKAETVTTINDISARLLPVELASPLAIVTFELLKNCLHHAFEPGSSANYIHLVSETEISDSDDHLELYTLNIRDSGLGIPGNIDLNALETSGLAIVHSLVTRLSGKMQIFAEGGTTVSVVVPIPDT